ncbi:phage tail protein [uncultured Aggregatibacter sp.]|uniref:phage tail-collar fiber domain-containing protein n=1 Tax=uncultured Aggregatibacter sp. TaxID=470564 RepID=UPI002624EC7B|nr:phage tail protein [uncultured Aggregatibacter sp.]
MAQYTAVFTTYGTQQLAKAIANNNPLTVTHFAVGDGNGNAVTVSASQERLVNEKYRATISAVSLDPRNNKQVVFELTIPENIGGFYIREMGVFDAQNKLIAYANCPESFKPTLASGSGKVQVMRMILLVASSNAVTLTVDDSVIFVTRGQLTPKTITANSANGFDNTGHSHAIDKASTTKAGIVQLTSDTGLDSENLGLTAKAGKKLAQLIATVQLALNNYIPLNKRSSAVNSNDENNVATSKAVKTAYDKGVEAKNAADGANNNANNRVSKSGDTMTGPLNINFGDYSFINQFNSSGKFSRIETTPDDQPNFYKLSYRSNDTELHSALLPKRGLWKVIAYEDWVNDNYIPLNKRSSAVNSKDENNVATSKAVKTAYDKGVEAKNAADGANNNANNRVSKSGDTMTGPLNINFGDYSFINQFNSSGKFSRIETTPDDQSNFYKLSYWSNDTELHSALLPKRGQWKVVAYEDWVNDRYVPRTGDTIINGNPTFISNGGFITINSTGVNWASIDYKVWNSPAPLVTTQAEDLGNYSVAFNVFTTPEGQDYNTDRREKTAQIHHNGRIWSKRYGWLDEQFAPANDTHKKSRCHNHWFPSHYAGTEVVDLPVDDTGGIRMTLMNVKVNDYHSPYVDIYLPMAYSGFANAIASDDGSEALSYGTDMIGNNIVRVYCKRSGNIGFRLHVIGWASF